jgi:hypothetical protein
MLEIHEDPKSIRDVIIPEMIVGTTIVGIATALAVGSYINPESFQEWSQSHQYVIYGMGLLSAATNFAVPKYMMIPRQNGETLSVSNAGIGAAVGAIGYAAASALEMLL